MKRTLRQEVGTRECALDNLLVQRGRVLGLEGQEATHHGVENNAQRPDVDGGASILFVLNLKKKYCHES